MLALLAGALAADWSGPRGLDDEDDRGVALGLGLGASFVGGANADGYAPAPCERLLVELPTGELVAVSIELDHSRHVLADAGAYFSSTDAPADAITGFRDYFVADLGLRFAVPVGDSDPEGVRVRPELRVGIGAAYTSTLLEVPGLDGPTALRSRAAWPAPGISAGAEVRLTRAVRLLPRLKAQAQVGLDAPESSAAPARPAVEWRLQPTLDVRVQL